MILAEDVEDHPDNQTRFVLVARDRVPKPTGHDKTSIVCFQRADHPGSLHGILGQFAARNINLTKLESRPTKQGLGDYCFVIDLSGHVGDEVVADCLRDLHAGLAGVKFLGSYPAAGEHGEQQRRQADAAWQAADEWLREPTRRYRVVGATWDRSSEPGSRRETNNAVSAASAAAAKARITPPETGRSPLETAASAAPPTPTPSASPSTSARLSDAEAQPSRPGGGCPQHHE